MEESIDMLSFYNDEISSLEKRLQEVVEKNTKQPILAQVEHFQNLLVVQKEKFAQLKHDIQRQKVRMKEYVTKEKEPLSDIQVNSHKLREEILMTTKIFTETKHTCYQFLAKVL
ncbi:hypothetical protein FLA_2883 [Filimonas lacunae]|nr:hypothetical protein FLA_2883 [Filimonas lacunae]